MKLRNFTKFFTGIALISALPVGVVISNPHTHTHSSLVVENKATNDINWSIDDNGNIWPTDRSKVSGAIEIPSVWDGKHVTGIAEDAFWKCSALTSITIPNSVTNIGKSAFEDCDKLTDVYLIWDENQIKKLQINDCIFNSTRGQITINFYIPKGMKELYITQTKDWFDASVVPNWIDDIVPPTPTPTNSSNLALILGLIFGSIALTGIGSYLGYRYYKHRKNSKK